LTEPFLSIIIPAYNEEKRLPRALEQVFAFSHTQPYSVEILVVENGSHDRTLQIAREFAASNPELRVLQESRKGKGLAVRCGMLEAHGSYRFMCDADLSMPIDQITRFLPPDLDNFDIAIASREAPGAVRFNEPRYRHWGGRLINLIIRLLALPGLHDTQCGFKCFTASVAEDLFRFQTITGWSFDIELLFIARRRGYHILEVPILWYYSAESKMSVVQDALRMIVDIIGIHSRARQKSYDLPSGH
jgi:dolichyl-phosphate beta-glucosyltransferase